MLGFMESLFSLRASVGLMVLAPSPEMCGAADCRLLEEEEGVCVRCAAGDRPGERLWLIGIELRSAAVIDAPAYPACCLDGGCNDFAFAARAVGNFGTPLVLLLRLEESVSRRLFLFRDGVRPIRGWVLSPAMRDTSL
jgi:hypothetical protein